MTFYTQRFLDDAAVETFAQQLKEKLATARAKGRSGWEQCATEYLQVELWSHVAKGDPLDVAAYCMFLAARNAPTRALAVGTDRACDHPEGCTHCNWCGYRAKLRDNDLARLINDLRNTAIEFGQTQQLRERIAHLVHDVLRRAKCDAYKEGADAMTKALIAASPEVSDAAIVAAWEEHAPVAAKHIFAPLSFARALLALQMPKETS